MPTKENTADNNLSAMEKRLRKNSKERLEIWVKEYLSNEAKGNSQLSQDSPLYGIAEAYGLSNPDNVIINLEQGKDKEFLFKLLRALETQLVEYYEEAAFDLYLDDFFRSFESIEFPDKGGLPRLKI